MCLSNRDVTMNGIQSSVIMTRVGLNMKYEFFNTMLSAVQYYLPSRDTLYGVKYRQTHRHIYASSSVFKTITLFCTK